MQQGAERSPEVTAIRAHDVTLCLGTSTVAVEDFDLVARLGMAVRLALHLRGVPAVEFEILKKVASRLLNIPTPLLRPVLDLMDEAEFVTLVTQGRTIKTVIPQIPYYDDVFSALGEVAALETMSEPEQLTLTLLDRLARSPLILQSAYNLGADRELVDAIVDIGKQGGYIIDKRMSGRDVLISPIYFSENSDKLAELVVSQGAKRIEKVVSTLGRHQGWPLAKIQTEKRIGEEALDDRDLQVVTLLASEGILPPPAITTSHVGTNYFIFTPRPGEPRLLPSKRPIYEAAMALVAAVRQGQLLPKAYAIRYPLALLRSLRDKKYLRATTESFEQYRQVAALRVGRLVPESGGFFRFELIDRPENMQAVDMAIALLSGEHQEPRADEELVMALRSGETYIESLLGRKQLVTELKQMSLPLDEETRQQVDDFILRAAL